MRLVDLTLPSKSNSPLLPAKIYLRNQVKLSALSVVNKSQLLKIIAQGYDLDSDLDQDYGVMVSKISMPTHGGTNIDAPRHFMENGMGIDEVPLSSLVGECVVFDASVEPGGMVELSDLKKYEGEIKPGDMILIRTGWADDHFGKADYLSEIPGVSEDVAKWLVERKVKAVAHDCFPDVPTFRLVNAPKYPNHTTYLSNNVVIIESLVNTKQIRAKRFLLVALPLKLVGSDGSPARVIGIENVNETGKYE
jgi:arylformamidase